MTAPAEKAPRVLPSPPVAHVRLDESERALVLAWRALHAYARERSRLDPLADDPPADDTLTLHLYLDGSGTVHVDPEDPNADEFDAITFYDLPHAVVKIDAARNDLEKAREERDRIRARRFGDPRKRRRT